MAADLLIKSGTVIDGSGGPCYRADVAVTGGRIVEIGRIRKPAAETIDCRAPYIYARTCAFEGPLGSPRRAHLHYRHAALAPVVHGARARQRLAATASIVPAAYSSVPKTGQNRRTSRPHLALRGTTWHKAPPTCTRTCAFEGPLGSPRRAIQPSSREKTAHDLRVGELQWPPEDGENVTNRTVNAPLKTGQNAEIGNAAVRAASGERAARARLPITVIDRQSLGEALAWWRKSYAT